MRDDPNAHWFLALRGLTPILAANWELLRKGPYGPLLQQRRVIRDTSANPTDPCLAEVMPLFDRAPSHISQPCKQAFEELRRVFSLPYSVCRTWLDIKASCYIWPGVISQTFIELVYDRTPEALVVLAHYCVLLKMIDSCWYLKGIGKTMLEAIEEELDEEWLPWIQWPKEQPLG